MKTMKTIAAAAVRRRLRRPPAPAAALAAVLSLALSAAASVAVAQSPPKDGGGSGDAPYKVVDGNKVDPRTLQGFRAWRAAACDRCHGAEQEGAVGPSLIHSVKQRSKDDVVRLILEGVPDRGMPGYKTVPGVADHVDALYAYLKGRADGAITSAKVEPIE